MNFQFSEEQQLLADSVTRLIDEHYHFDARKKIIASEHGWSPAVYAKLSELGLTALPFAESLGGFGAGALEMIPVMQALGRGLLVEPLVNTLSAPAYLLDQAATLGQSALAQPVLSALIEGSARVTLAHDEANSRWDLSAVRSSATRHADGHWRVQGEKRVVLHAQSSQWMLLSARLAGEHSHPGAIALFLVASDTPGLHMKTYRTYDDQRAADIGFDLKLDAQALLLGDGDAMAHIEAACDWAQVLMCSEALGVMDEANRLTLEYLKTRKQFGMPIGAFQALQHRMVDMMMSAEQSRSITYLACDRVDAAKSGRISASERARAVSMARVKVNEAARHIGQESIQLHGGMGMTIEMKISHNFKRLTAMSQQFGDLDHHLDRLARPA